MSHKIRGMLTGTKQGGLVGNGNETLTSWSLNQQEWLTASQFWLIISKKTPNPMTCDLTILLMEEILHHLAYIKPCKYWDIDHINWRRISSINSINSWCSHFSSSRPVAKIHLAEVLVGHRNHPRIAHAQRSHQTWKKGVFNKEKKEKT